MSDPTADERAVVLSPHADDGVLSLGATLAGWARAGSRVEVVTVFGGDPNSVAAPGRWDRISGFSTYGEATRRRREEDRRACDVLGVAARSLSFGGRQYESVSRRDLREAVASACAGADVVLVPGFPIVHEDHLALALAALPVGGDVRVGLYVEQPYAIRAFSNGKALGIPESLRDAVSSSAVFAWQHPGPRDRLAKWRAIGRYRTQLPMLGGLTGVPGGSGLRIRVAVIRAGEAIAWL